jgi:DNA-binding LytR/AlgR family response regulator
MIGGGMLIKAITDEKYTQTELHVCKDRKDEEVRQIITELHALFDTALTGTDERGNKVKLAPRELFAIYAEGQKFYCLGQKEKYALTSKLYELEKKLESAGFIRISRSEIINMKHLKCLDLSFTGTIKLTMTNGYETYTSRRNVAKIKEMLAK